MAQSDYIVVQLPLNDSTRGMIDAAVLGVMKPGGYLVNTSRGAVVDVDAALSALELRAMGPGTRYYVPRTK